MWKFCGNTRFSQSFGRIARNSVETVGFHKISTPGNYVKLRVDNKQNLQHIWTNSVHYQNYTKKLAWKDKHQESFILRVFQICQYCWDILSTTTAWKVSRYGDFSGPYFTAFGLNTGRYSVSLRIQSECGKIRTRKKPRIWTLFIVCFSVIAFALIK